MRYKGINLRDLAEKIPAADAKDGFGRLQAQPDVAPKAPDHKSTRGVENVFLAAAHGDKAVAMSLLDSLMRRMGKTNQETTEATICDRLAAFLRVLGDDPTSDAATLRRSILAAVCIPEEEINLGGRPKVGTEGQTYAAIAKRLGVTEEQMSAGPLPPLHTLNP